MEADVVPYSDIFQIILLFGFGLLRNNRCMYYNLHTKVFTALVCKTQLYVLIHMSTMFAYTTPTQLNTHTYPQVSLTHNNKVCKPL